MRRADVRRLIDKRSRQRLAQWIGVPLEKLAAMPRHASAQALGANAPDIGRLVERGHLPALDDVDGERLACEGYLLVVHEGAPLTRPCPLLRLALPRELPPPWPGAGAGIATGGAAAAASFDAGGAALFAAQLPELFPEWAWLFG